MKNLAKLIVVAIFALGVLGLVLAGSGATGAHSALPTPTPPKTANANAAAKPANAAVVATPTPSPASAANSAVPAPPRAGNKKMQKEFTLNTESLTEDGDVAFNHDNHAFKNYSEDLKSPVACVMCHHTDQPKSALTPPLITSDRDQVMTYEVWLASSLPVATCRSCHFRPDEVPSGKTMPKATYPNGKTKVLDNKEAYHINCNDCHDRAYKLNPSLKKKPGFATGADCLVCHLENK